jgi:hypothetical protein
VREGALDRWDRSELRLNSDCSNIADFVRCLDPIICLPVQIPLKSDLPGGASLSQMATHVLLVGLYLPPVLIDGPFALPQTIISLPVHTAA